MPESQATTFVVQLADATREAYAGSIRQLSRYRAPCNHLFFPPPGGLWFHALPAESLK